MMSYDVFSPKITKIISRDDAQNNDYVFGANFGSGPNVSQIFWFQPT